MMKAFVLVFAICIHGDHMVGIPPRGVELVHILCDEESDDRGNNICKPHRDGILYKRDLVTLFRWEKNGAKVVTSMLLMYNLR